MASKALIAAIVLHLLVAVGLAHMEVRRRATAPVTIEIVGGDAHRAQPPSARLPAPALPGPPARAASMSRPHHAAPAPTPRPSPAVEPSAHPAPAAPLDTGLTLGNEPGGGGTGVTLPRASAPRPESATPAPRHPKTPHKVAAPAIRPAEAECHEAPTRPLPLARPVAIEYTHKAQEDNVEGRLVLAITVGVDGFVTRVDVTSPVEPELDAAAVAAVKTWRFEPSLRCGKPAAGGVYTIARRFELGD